jgi:hypothetical protein
VVDTANNGLERTIEVPLSITKARLLRQAGFLFVRRRGYCGKSRFPVPVINLARRLASHRIIQSTSKTGPRMPM